MATILCVDDEPSVGALIEHTLSRAGHKSLLVAGVEEAMQTVARTPVDLILADYRMSHLAGIDLLELLRQESRRIPVIIMTGFSSIEQAVTAIKGGAIDYLTKPLRAETLEIAVQQALEVVRLRRENEAYRREITKLRSTHILIGGSEPFRKVMEMISMVAPTGATVLLQGESGTGKELFARAIHDQSSRQDGPFISLNCAAVPEGLVESALFGHDRETLSGATVRTAGPFEQADGGTLVLGDISEVRMDLQARLLRVIQEQELERVGGTRSIKVDVRVVATTKRNLKDEVLAGRFRADFYYRLNVMPIRIPPLRECADDIPRLVNFFLHRTAEIYGIPVPTVPPETLRLLQQHRWPGNVRELANSVERAVILSRAPVLLPSAFEESVIRAGAGALDPATAEEGMPFDLDELERRAIQRALAATGGNRTRAAKLLGISERTLRNKLNVRRESA
jgi:DNA-binding NtrC family response regulator